jgi:hypothetical protein
VASAMPVLCADATTISSMYADTRALTSSNTEKEVKIMEQVGDTWCW